MNLANKLTLFRILLVPFFVAAMLINPFGFLWALIIFIVASVTDFLDGYIARKYNMLTAFGKFLDPIADKILVVSALICFTWMGLAPVWAVITIISREFIVSGIRLAAVESKEKTVISASFSGKLKTAFTMLAICGILVMLVLAQFDVIKMQWFVYEWMTDYRAHGIINHQNDFYISQLICNLLIYICTALTVISGIQYIWDYRSIFKSDS